MLFLQVDRFRQERCSRNEHEIPADSQQDQGRPIRQEESLCVDQNTEQIQSNTYQHDVLASKALNQISREKEGMNMAITCH